jgi:hypothetical protein
VFDVSDHTYTFANPYIRASEILGCRRLKSSTGDDVIRASSMSSKAGFRKTREEGNLSMGAEPDEVKNLLADVGARDGW